MTEGWNLEPDVLVDTRITERIHTGRNSLVVGDDEVSCRPMSKCTQQTRWSGEESVETRYRDDERFARRRETFAIQREILCIVVEREGFILAFSESKYLG